jgi:hypothetical protein
LEAVRNSNEGRAALGSAWVAPRSLVGTAHGFDAVSLIDGEAEPESPARGARPVVIIRIQLHPADASTV